jgi:hypothetical protein
MSKRIQIKHFSHSLFLLYLFTFYATQIKAQKESEIVNCFILADGKKLQLFENILAIRSRISISRDIEYPNSKIFLYGYDAMIRKSNNYIITPQILFFVDTTIKRTIKEQAYFNIERSKKDGDISKGDLANIFGVIKKYIVPFFMIDLDADFEISRKYDSKCHPYTLEISKVVDEYGDSSSRQFTLIITLTY